MEFEALVAGIDVDWLGLKQYVVKLLVTIVATYGFLYVLRYSLSVFFRKTSYLDHKKEQTIESVLKTSFNYFSFLENSKGQINQSLYKRLVFSFPPVFSIFIANFKKHLTF